MIKITKTKIIVAILLLSIPALVIYCEIDSWELIKQTESPDAKFTLRVYRYLSDIDRHAPYANYVTINPKSVSSKWNKGHIVLAAYCNDAISMTWVSNTNIEINCQIANEKDVRTFSAKAYGIDIHLTNR